MMAQGYFHRVQALTATRFWINNVTRQEADMAIEAGACGCTQNPAYTWKMINSEDAGERAYVLGALDEILQEESDGNQALIAL